MQKKSYEENKVIELIKSENPFAIKAFDKLYTRFQDEYVKDGTIHVLIIKTIYINHDFDYIWQLARDYNVSDSMLLRYRKDYLDWFYFYYNQEIDG